MQVFENCKNVQNFENLKNCKKMQFFVNYKKCKFLKISKIAKIAKIAIFLENIKGKLRREININGNEGN